MQFVKKQIKIVLSLQRFWSGKRLLASLLTPIFLGSSLVSVVQASPPEAAAAKPITLIDAEDSTERKIEPALKVKEENVLGKTKTFAPELVVYDTLISTAADQPLVIGEKAELAGDIVAAEEERILPEDTTTEVKEEILYYKMQTNAVEGKVTDNRIFYKDLWPATDLIVTTEEFGVKENLILKDPRAPVSFDYVVETFGLILEVSEEGGLIFWDENGAEKFYTPPPNITDAQGLLVTEGVRYELGAAAVKAAEAAAGLDLKEDDVVGEEGSTEGKTDLPEVPASESSDVEVPASESSDVEVPASESSDPEVPVSESSDVEVPASESSDPEVPASESSDVEVPGSESSDVEVPVSESSDVEVPASESSDVEVPGSESSDPETSAETESETTAFWWNFLIPTAQAEGETEEPETADSETDSKDEEEAPAAEEGSEAGKIEVVEVVENLKSVLALSAQAEEVVVIELEPPEELTVVGQELDEVEIYTRQTFFFESGQFYEEAKLQQGETLRRYRLALVIDVARKSSPKILETDSDETDSGETETGGTDSGGTDSDETETGETDSGETDSGETDSDGTDSGETETGETETGGTDSGETETGETDSGETDSGGTETSETDSGETDSDGTDSGETDSDGTETGGTDSGETETGGTETGETDSGETETGGTETGGTETGETDSGGTDSDETETGETDSDGTDSGETDSGETDSGETETGETETGETDSGETDSGGTETSETETGETETGGTETDETETTSFWRNFLIPTAQADSELAAPEEPTLTLVDETVLYYPLDVDPSTFVRLLDRGTRVFAPNFSEGSLAGTNSQLVAAGSRTKSAVNDFSTLNSVTLVDRDGSKFAVSEINNSQNWLLNSGTSLQTSVPGARLQFNTPAGTEIWADLNYSPTGGVARVKIDPGTKTAVSSEIDLFALNQGVKGTLLATGLPQAAHSIEIEILPSASTSSQFAIHGWQSFTLGSEIVGKNYAGTAQGGSTTTLIDSNFSQAQGYGDGYFTGYTLRLTSGAAQGQTVYVTGFSNSAINPTFTFQPALAASAAVTNGVTYQLIPDGILLNERATRGLAVKDSGTRIAFGQANLPIYNGTSQRGTLTLWVKPDFAASNETGKHFIFDTGFQKLYFDGQDKKFHLTFLNGRDFNLKITSRVQNFRAQEALHLAVGWSQNSGLQLFVNGEKTKKRARLQTQPLAPTDQIVFGTDSSGAQPFKGVLAEPQLFNYLLLDTEVFEIYQAKSPSVIQPHKRQITAQTQKGLLFNAPLTQTPNDRFGLLAGRPQLGATSTGTKANVTDSPSKFTFKGSQGWLKKETSSNEYEYATFETPAETTKIVAGFQVGNEQGIARVIVDPNTPQEIITEIDTFAATQSTQRFLVAAGLESKKHVIRLEGTGNANPNSTGNTVTPKFLETNPTENFTPTNLTVKSRVIGGVLSQNLATLPKGLQFPAAGNFAKPAGTIEFWLTGTLSANASFCNSRASDNWNGLALGLNASSQLEFKFANASQTVALQTTDNITALGYDQAVANHILGSWWLSEKAGTQKFHQTLYFNGKKVAEKTTADFAPSSHTTLELGKGLNATLYDFAIYAQAFEDGGVALTESAAADSEVGEAYNSVAHRLEHLQAFETTTNNFLNLQDGSNKDFGLERGALKSAQFFEQGQEVSASVQKGSFALLKTDLTKAATTLTIEGALQAAEIPTSKGILYLGAANAPREKIYYTGYNSTTKTFSGLTRGLGATVAGNFAAGAVVEIAGKATFAEAPAKDAEVFAVYQFSGDVLDRARSEKVGAKSATLFLNQGSAWQTQTGLAANHLVQNLIAYYPLDGDLKEAQRETNNGVVSGDPKFKNGLLAKALDFDGDDFFEVANGFNNSAQVYSLGFWFRTTAKDGYLVELKKATAFDALLIDATGKLKYGAASGPGFSTNKEVSDGLWHHVLLIHNNNNNSVKLYLDGNDLGGLTSGVPDLDEGFKLALAGQVAGSNLLQVTIDDVAVWARVLTAAEVHSLARTEERQVAQTAAQTALTQLRGTELSAVLTETKLAGGKISFLIDEGTPHEKIIRFDTSKENARQKIVPLATGLTAGLHTLRLITQDQTNTEFHAWFANGAQPLLKSATANDLIYEKPLADLNPGNTPANEVPGIVGGNDEKVKLLLHSDTEDGSTTFQDSSAAKHPINSYGGIKHSTQEPKFGSSAIQFDGTDDYLAIPDSADFDLSGNYTLDFWVKRISDKESYLFTRQTAANDPGGVAVKLEKDGDVVLTYGSNTHTWPASIPKNQWTHLTFSHLNNETQLFRNGKQFANAWQTTINLDSSAKLLLGRGLEGQPFFEGYLDEIRLTKDLARYENNFTPKVGAYDTVSSGTVEQVLTASKTAAAVAFSNSTSASLPEDLEASWFKATSSAFPERANLVSSRAGFQIFNADNNSPWLTLEYGSATLLGPLAENAVTALAAAGGKIFLGLSGSSSKGLLILDFAQDKIFKLDASGLYLTQDYDFRAVNTAQPNWTLQAAAKKLVNTKITALAVSSNLLAIATESGVTVVDLKNNDYHTYSQITPAVTALNFNSDLYFATGTKINSLPATSLNSSALAQNGLPAPTVKEISAFATEIKALVSDANALYVGTKAGVEKLQRTDLSREGTSPYLAQSGGTHNLLFGATKAVQALALNDTKLVVATTDGTAGHGALSLVQLGTSPTLDDRHDLKSAVEEGLAGDIFRAVAWSAAKTAGGTVKQVLAATSEGITVIELATTTNSAPKAPVLVAPQNGSYVTTNKPQLIATYQDPEAYDFGKTRYRLTKTSFADCLNDTNVITRGESALTTASQEEAVWQLGANLANGTYYWCAQNDDEALQSPWTEMGSFLVDANLPVLNLTAGPSATERTGIENGKPFDHVKTGKDGKISLAWNAPNSASGGDRFYYKLDSNPNPTSIAGKAAQANNPTGSTSLSVDDLALTGGTNYFHLQFKNNSGAWSTEQVFTLAYTEGPSLDLERSKKVFDVDGTEILSKAVPLAATNVVQIKPILYNSRVKAQMDFFVNVVPVAESFVLKQPTRENADGTGKAACLSGTSYADCASKVWYVAIEEGDYRNQASKPKVVIPGLPEAQYKVQANASDDNLLFSYDAEFKNPFEQIQTTQKLNGQTLWSQQGAKEVVTADYLPVESSKTYLLSGLFKSKGAVKSKLNFGLIPYDANKEEIKAPAVLRRPAAVKVSSFNNTQITTVETPVNWFQAPTEGASQRSLGFYYAGDTSKLPDYVVTDFTKGAYSTTGTQQINLTAALPSAVQAGIQAGTTKVMNHYGKEGSHLLLAAEQAEVPKEWTDYRDTITGEEFGNNPKVFRPGTKYVRIYFDLNSGQGQDAEIVFDQVKLQQVEASSPEETVTTDYIFGKGLGLIDLKTKYPIVIKDHYLEGYALAESIGWLNFRAGNPENSDCSVQPYQTATDYGVLHDGNGNLCGYAYSETLGWLSFLGQGYQVHLTKDGKLSGQALSEVLGFIEF